ncbi:HAD family hydrolase [Nocardia ignorata]|uniref:Beta-phosphoglucomutase n=1 Tax=Nocardia ignorata TaxID=145285 RepID=A0A4R6P171_NOCIG|nr:beta-phosphoglucomutase family hydrolase [Nocardia ignorata]TDP31191.1 HAD superfamily hydrolase (TIGR01509 family)/beta-phosphoglucomutase family hydrolase [Nocardia ignorata]
MTERVAVQRAAAVLFDLDGVLTDTAAVHRRAWTTLFTEFLPPQVAPFTDDDYYNLVDGKPRIDGVRAVLSSRGLRLPDGTVDDLPEAATVHGLGNRKNGRFTEIVHRDGVDVFDGSLRLVNALAALRIPMGVVSSSRNAELVLDTADLLDRFAVIVDGTVAERDGLAGKPDPAMFLAAARALGVEPTETIVIEDAVSGVEAGRRGGFRVIGVDRGTGPAALRAAGADVVIGDLADLLT